ALAIFVFCLGVAAFDQPKQRQSDAARTAATAHDGDMRFEADIIVGRVEVMQEQTRRGLDVVAGVHINAEPQEADHDTYRRLYNAVGRYNTLRTSACTASVVGGNLCGGAPYLPLWYAGRARPDTSGPGLKVMAEDMQNTMTPLWDAGCAKAKAKSGDQHFCAIE